MISRIRIQSVLIAGGLLLAGFTAQAQVAGSQHDLTSLGDSQDGGTDQTTQVCIFCHTPHGGDTAAPVPLWNKTLPNPGSYTRFSSIATPSFDSAEAPVGSVSLACLSCHDGTQAMDVVLNSPGSGGYVPGGAEFDPNAITTMTGTPVPNLGTDLSNDHPISMQYAGGGAVASDTDNTQTPLAQLGDQDFNAPYKTTINNEPIWWVDSAGDASGGGTVGVREKQDMLLYTRDEATVAGGPQPFVECGSCHDPHNSSTQGAGSVAFLRIANASSQVCTACHTK
jgi:hypothetical protein